MLLFIYFLCWKLERGGGGEWVEGRNNLKGCFVKNKIKAFFLSCYILLIWNIMGFEKRDDKITHIFFFSLLYVVEFRASRSKTKKMA